MSKEKNVAPDKMNALQTNQQHKEKDAKPEKQNAATTQDNEDDPLLKEGYLPEIYFTLKSDNPADW